MQILSLLLVVFVDSLGNGLAFSTLAIVLFDPSFLSVDNISLNQYMGVIYELLIGVYSFSMFFSAPIIGEISDKLGRKPALKFSMLGLTIGLVLCAFGCYQKSLLILLLGRLISGFTAGSLSVAQAAIVDLSSPENKSRYLSIILIANCLGFALVHFYLNKQVFSLRLIWVASHF
ncbi:MAG: MFS transporter [Rickettsiaceae bacterium]|nr:MFS transporter [Rickettsiaceae bacterium]